MDLHQKVTCLEDLLQSLPIAITRRGLVIGHIAMLQGQAAKNASGCLSALVLCLTAWSLQMRNVRSCCPVVVCFLQPTKSEGRRFYSCPAVFSLVFLWCWAWSKGSCPSITSQTSAPITAPHFPKFHFLLLEQKPEERVVYSCQAFWLLVLALCLTEKLCSFLGYFGSFLVSELISLDFRKGVKKMRSKKVFGYLT